MACCPQPWGILDSACHARKAGHGSVKTPGMTAFGGGFNRSSQHLLILLDQEVSAWNGQLGLGLRRDRRESCGSAGRTGNALRTLPVRLEDGTKAAFTGSLSLIH